MNIKVCADGQELGTEAAKEGASHICNAIAKLGHARIVLATGESQFAMLAALVDSPAVDWSRVTAFHLDEYIGMEETHSASFRRYLRERVADKVPISQFHYINGLGLEGDGDLQAECDRLGALITEQPIDVAFIGIGENGHLAFNDPPADFDTKDPYLVVTLDEACRRQQLGEGWFTTLEEVPRQGISMSIHQVMHSQHIVCSVPDKRKAQAVRSSLEGIVTNLVPASILQQHGHTTVFLEPLSASLLQLTA